MKKTINRRMGALLCVIAVIFWLAAGVLVHVSAEDDTGTLSIWCVKNDQILDGMHWKIYRIGERDGDNFKLEGDFANYRVTFGKRDENANTWDAEVLKAAASTLSSYILADQIPFTDEGWIGKDGVLNFSGLENGLYLVCGDYFHQGAYDYFPSAILFEMDNKQESKLNAFPKLNEKLTQNASTGGEKKKFSVLKKWKNDEGQEWNRSVKIKVEVYKDADPVPYDTQWLSEDNDWYAEWEGDAKAIWTVVEREIPDGYTVAVLEDETSIEKHYILVNTFGDIFQDYNVATGTTPMMDENEHTGTTNENQQQYVATQTTAGGTEKFAEHTISVSETSVSSTAVTGDTSTTTRTTQTTALTGTTGRIIETVKRTVQTTVAKTYNNNVVGGGSSGGYSGGGGSSGGSSGGKLPQTGQLWWPVPFLSVGGILFMAAGVHLRKRDSE